MRPILISILAVTFSLAAYAQTATEQLIYSFCQESHCTDGAKPTSSMALLSNGSFVVAPGGFKMAGGAIVMFTPTGQANNYSADILTEFCDGSTTMCPAGFAPQGPPIEALNSNIYFANQFGGLTTYNSAGSGILWQYAPPYGNSELEDQLFDFCSDANCAGGGTPSSGLIQGADGALYGSTSANGAGGYGSIFRIDTSGSITVLHHFCSAGNCADGNSSNFPLLQAADGNFYGTTQDADGYSYGTVFQLTPTGNYSVLHSFCTDLEYCPDGDTPVGSLVQADNGNIYGVTMKGGNNYSGGTVYYIDTNGTFHTYANFACIKGGGVCVNGWSPKGGLMLGSDGNLYGTTTVSSKDNGASGYGAAFKLPLNLSHAGSATNIFYYCAAGPPCVNGSDPSGEFVVGVDGNLYGVLTEDATNSGGAAYLLTTSSWLQPPVQLTLSAASVAANTPVTLSWRVPYAYSKTAQMCGAFVQNFTSGAGIWTGLQTGSYSNHAYSGSSVITPTAAGTYTYALTCSGKESGFATLTVTAPAKSATTTSLAVSPSSLSVGQTAALKATVTSSAGTPTGTVTFYHGSDALTAINLKSGVASFTASTNGLPPGTYVLSANYSGDSNYNSSSGTDSVKLGQAPTSTTLTVSPSSVTPPANVTLTATVKRSASGATGNTTGSVTFYANGTDALATERVNSSGVATVTASSKGYPAGKYAITAKYLGDSDDATSTSTAVDVTLK